MIPEQRQEIIRILQSGEELSPEWARILFPPEKREYELVYHGKEREEDILADTLAVPLQPVRTFGRNGGNGWKNMVIFGDNLQVMKSLLALKKVGKLCNADGTPGVRLIYVDPPFATKQEFRGSEAQKAYQDRISGGQFLEFMRRRLVFFRSLLAENGALYVHLDYRKMHYLKALGDEIFGENNFMNEVIWCYRERGISRTFWNNKHQTILAWARSLGSQLFNCDAARIPYSEEYLKKFKYEDENGRYQIRGKNIQGSPVQRADGLTPEAEKKYPGLTYRQYLKDGQLPLDWWEMPLLNKAADERLGYPTQKPERLLERIIKASSNRGDIVLDAFAGSGTTCAVAEKLGRRWIGIDCGKLAIYTMQKRMLNLRREIGNKGPKLDCKPFVLYNAGLYDFSTLKKLPWDSWRFFALQLFQCRDEPHKVGGVQLDGYLKGSSVLVFNHMKHPKARFTEETLEELHEALGSRVGSRMFIVAPALTFDFQQDYIDLDGVRYYALRIPYSIINELHQREFTALKQPADEMAINDTVEAVGFDFIRTPELKFECGAGRRRGELIEQGFIRIKTFKSEAVVREPMRKKGNLETLSMVMLDYDFDEKSQIFDLDAVLYADALQKENWELRFPLENLGEKMMAVFIDIYGNEARVMIDADEFGKKTKGGGNVAGKKAKKAVRARVTA